MSPGVSRSFLHPPPLQLPAYVRVAPQAAFGGLRGDADAGARPAFDVETNVKYQGTSPWPVSDTNLCSTARVGPRVAIRLEVI